jgi:hypothetical protein
VTRSFAFLGDSTVDFGNLDAVARSLGERRPFGNKAYDGGGNVKASDGYLLGEHLVRRLGASSSRSPDRLLSAELINLADEPLRRGLREKDPNAQVFNFAYAGATSGGRGSRLAGLEDFRIGLRRQAATLARTASWISARSDLDVIISGGTNDVFDFLENNQDQITLALITPGREDDRHLAERVAKNVVTNINASLDGITGLYDEALVIGTTKLSALPRVREASREISRTPLIGRSLAGNFRKFVDRISASINTRLEETFNSDNRNGIFAVNGIEAWESIRSPGFIDTIHPDSQTNHRLANFALDQIRDASGFDSFGL